MSIFASWSNVKMLAITHLPQSPPSSYYSIWSTTLLLDPSIIQCSSELNMDGGHHLVCFMWIYWYTYIGKTYVCYVLCLNGDFQCSSLSSLPSVDRNLSTVWSCCCCPWKPCGCGCPPLLYTSSILLHRAFSSMHFDAAWSFDAAPGYKYVGRRAYLLINQWQERSHARWKPAPCQSRMMNTAQMIVIM